MDHRRISWLLIAAGAVAALGGAFLFFVYAPLAGLACRETVPELAYLFIPGLVFIWFIGILYALAMACYFRVCLRIGKGMSFHRENVKDLSRIAFLLLSAGAVWVLGIPLGLLLRLGFGAWCFAFLLAAAASAAMGGLAKGLSLLLRRAVALQEENDLTV